MERFFPLSPACDGKPLSCASVRKKCLFFRPAASHSVRLCTCPPDCRTNGQTAWLAKAVRAMFARPFQVWHLPSTRSPQMPAVPRLVFGLSAQLLSCLSGRQPFLPWTAGCGLLTAASSAFASAGVRGLAEAGKRFRQVHRLQAPWLEGVGSPMQKDTRRGWKSKEE